jgi:hypothetical protein
MNNHLVGSKCRLVIEIGDHSGFTKPLLEELIGVQSGRSNDQQVAHFSLARLSPGSYVTDKSFTFSTDRGLWMNTPWSA